MGLTALWFLPFCLGPVPRLWDWRRFFGDYREITCAGTQPPTAQSIYTLSEFCRAQGAAQFVYPKAVARVFAAAVHLAGPVSVGLLYGLIYYAGLTAMLYVLLRRAAPSYAFAKRRRFMGLVTGFVAIGGNIAVPLHAMVAGVGLVLGADTLAFGAAVLVAAMVKPIFLVLVAPILFAPGRLWRRLGLAAGVVALGVAYALWPSADMLEWRTAISHEVVAVEGGGGFTGLLTALGLRSPIWFTFGYLPFAAVVGLSGWVIAASLDRDREGRLWVGITTALLLLPRLQSYDMVLLPTGFLVALDSLRRLGAPAARLDLAMTVICAFSVLFLLNGGKIESSFASPVKFVALAGAWVAVAAATYRRVGLPAIIDDLGAASLAGGRGFGFAAPAATPYSTRGSR